MRLTENRPFHSAKDNNTSVRSNSTAAFLSKQAWILFAALIVLMGAFKVEEELNQGLLSGIALIALIIFLKTLSKNNV